MAPRPGYIYVMRLHASPNAYECPMKIGQSVHPTARRGQLGIVMPYELSIILSFPADDMDKAEQYCHGALSKYHLQGEWFKLDKRVLQIFFGVVKYEDGAFFSEHVLPTLPDDFWDGSDPRDLPF